MSGLNKDLAPIVAEELKRYMPDLVEVVRCGECAYVNARREDIVRCEAHRMWHTPMWYCADGERMGEE